MPSPVQKIAPLVQLSGADGVYIGVCRKAAMLINRLFSGSFLIY
ncbi:hypothetical protein PUV54_16250 [Hyphococcus flavus]|uniref:Uncharacterized protein n=1 Tax=Hyphococcus flavus TaxID=1866326 RepID=A0AAE9ZBE5_9PROT|nr:hypothetical protein [Hyphococcus flavus]WDI31504.1 hypothetical protein PUV54_16250 [Hyphococcus flavus]